MVEAALVGVVGVEREELLTDLEGLRRERKAADGGGGEGWREGKEGKRVQEVVVFCWPAAGLKTRCSG